jgi:uncharacterized OsmC-like protein
MQETQTRKIRVLGFKEEKERREVVEERAKVKLKIKEFTEDQIQNLSLMGNKMCVRTKK